MGGVVSNISKIKTGAGDVKFLAVDGYIIKELQGNGTATIIFPSDVNFKGGINTTGGQSH